MTGYQPLDCDLHDYLEIACLYGYQLLIERTDGVVFHARAVTTLTRPGGEEFLCLMAAEGECEVRLDHLAAITPLDAQRRFARIEMLSTGTCAL